MPVIVGTCMTIVLLVLIASVGGASHHHHHAALRNNENGETAADATHGRLLPALRKAVRLPSLRKATAPIHVAPAHLGEAPKTSQTTPAAGEEHGQPCHYEGHCPIGYTCTPNKHYLTSSSNSGWKRGTCQKIVVHQPKEPTITTSTSDGDDWLDDCIQTCQAELLVDEHFYYEKQPVWNEQPQLAISSDLHPRACLVQYQRTAEDAAMTHQQPWFAWQGRPETPTHEANPEIWEWTQNSRFRHVVRIDPVVDPTQLKWDINQSHEAQIWQAYCTAPCRMDQDCNVGVHENNGFICLDGACQRNLEFWNNENDEDEVPNVESSESVNLPESDAVMEYQTRAPHQIPRMVLVTGATGTYMRGLRNFVASARYWAPHHPVVVYNLGTMSDENIAEIQSWSNVLSLEWKDGLPDHYPAHIKYGKKYAWKPLILNETVHKYGSIFWMDAGSTLAGPVTPVENVLHRTGLFLVKGQDLDMRGMAHKGSFAWFNISHPDAYQLGPHFSGNTQGYLYPSRYIDSIVIPNAECALQPSCIMPDGSDLHNHRFDQTTLSLLAYQPQVKAPHYTEYLAASRPQLQPNLKAPSFRFVWTARQGCQFYADLYAKRQDLILPRGEEYEGDEPDFVG